MRDSPNGIFCSWAWYTHGSARYTEFLGRRRRRRRRRRRHLLQTWAKELILQNWHVPKFQKRSFFRHKSPCGSFPQKVTFSESTPRELTHSYRDLKIQRFPKKWKLDGNLPIKIKCLPKTKMVRMVHTNNLYEIGLEISDPEKKLWTKSKI